MTLENTWVYDLETFPNIFTFCILNTNGEFQKVFEVSDRKNQTQDILKCLRFLRSNKQKMVGFNNLNFDYPIIHQMMLDAISAKKGNRDIVFTADYLYGLAQKQINSFKDERFGNTIQEKEILIPQIDLYKIHHFDNRARATSLKMIEFNMNSDNIEDLPFPVGTILIHEEMDTLISYNKHDVKMTLDFYKESVKAIEFRGELSAKLGKDFTNANDTKIGKDFFIMKLEQMKPGCCYTKNKFGRKIRQTKREYIDLKDCLFDYYDFKRPEFIAVKDWFTKQRITETKGVFTNIEEHNLGEIAKYADLKTKRQKFFSKPTQEQIDEFLSVHPMGWVEETPLKTGKSSYWKNWRVTGKPSSSDDSDKDGGLNVKIDGFRFDFGVGGIHGSVESAIIRADDYYEIVDADVTSMYPSIAIANRIYPEHLGESFCDIYQSLFEQRKSYPKGSPENALFKLALNGVYGDSNNQYSPLYDPKYTMSITVNGQLSLCLLAERLMDIEGLSLIQVNTDGITVKLPRNKRQQYDDICKQWQTDTKLMLEYADYSAMYIRDVNNYLALYTNGKVKRKGAYEYEDLDWSQNHSAKIIAMAAEAVLVHGKDLESFIKLHNNKWDFMLRAKVPRNSRLILEKDGEVIPLQNICRYYPCKSGGKLIKIMPPLEGKTEERRLSLDKEWNVKPCNNILDFNWDIDYDYFVQETKKLLLR